ncbi:strumpellin and WASH-interacting protein [Leptinotarsa decemlineata]|uniref:strumpellin and WASH-interacting protein n=1 Tax=Leptinotarsa decemlineata TaxID=7539 RepID=UPI003D303EC1
MWEPLNLAEKKFNAETTRLIGEAQLHRFGSFLEKYHEETTVQKSKFTNANNVTAQIVSVDEHVYKNEINAHLVHSDNKMLSRIIASLGGVCNEMNMLVEDAEVLFPHFILYGNSVEKNSKHLSIGRIIEPLQQIHSYVKRVQLVVVLTLKQLSALLVKKIYTTSNTSAFPDVLHTVGDVLICLLKLDHLLDSQVLKDHWFLYRKSVKNILHSNRNSFDRKQLTSFDKKLQQFENDLLMGHILKSSVEKCLEEKSFYYQMKNCNLNQEFYAFINALFNELEKEEENSSPQLWWKLNIFTVFYFTIFENTDKKLLKKVLDINRKISACTLIGNIMWYPEQFLLKHIHSLEKQIDEKVIENHRLNLINARNTNYPRESIVLCMQVCCFLMEMEKIGKLNTNTVKVRELQIIVTALNAGLKLAKKISYSIMTTLNLHADKDLPLTKSVILAICRLIEILKCIPIIFRKNMIMVTYIILLIIQHSSHRALGLLGSIRKQFTQEKSYSERQLDVLASLNLCEQVLKGPVTKQGILVANLALSASGLYTSTLAELKSVLNQLEMLSTVSKTVKETSNCFFLYWHQNYMLPIYFSKLIASKNDLSRYYLFLAALSDFSVKSDPRVNDVSNQIIHENFYKPVEQVIEMSLRLQTHLHLQLPHTDPFENYFSINFSKYPPAPMNDGYKCIKNETEHHLSTVFYNLTSVVLHDWKTYGEMRRLANMQYGLDTVDDNLPMQTLEQGLDVLEIMRNINVFVSNYLYNLNSQIFIERNSENKHLNSIKISQVANSIRTHGVGIMNTTVNFTYQFLRSKFHIFSQFIYDEHIKSRLIKDLRFFSEHKHELNQMYPYERAEKFNIGIKKLGLNQNGESYLDLFRNVVTHIGNAMGYVRLIRSGGRRCLAEGACFIPDLKKEYLKEIIQKEEMPDLSKNAATGLLDNLQMFLDNMEDATEYFKLLVKVFVPVLRNKNNIHLKNFYIIVPPLTINFIEHSLNCKERINKRNKAEYTFTDDGFALGLAYIIEILNQAEQLNSLHWFHSIQRKFKNDRTRIKEQIIQAGNYDNKLYQTLTLTEKKNTLYEREFQLLYYSFNSARLFFQT